MARPGPPHPTDVLPGKVKALPEALDQLRAQLVLAFTTEDLKEDIAAFREKRPPVWKSL
jgi:hypothetical protein